MYNRQPPNTSRADRWKREDEATRLSDEIPALKALRLDIYERRGDQAIQGTKYTRHIIVSRAAALFVLPCSEPKCQDGGHEVTFEVMRKLRELATSFEGTSTCCGYVGDNPCSRELHYIATAQY